jgi:STE24 endopeptidase
MNEDKSSRYNRQKRRADVASYAWTILLFVVLLVTPGSIAMRDAAEFTAARFGAAAPTVAVLVYVLLLGVLNEIVDVPLGFYNGFVLEHRYGASTETIGGWLRDKAKSFALALVLGGGAAGVLYAIIRASPERWWLPAGAVFIVLVIAMTNLVPVLLLPLFYSVRPLTRDELLNRLLSLADRAGARIVGAYEWGLSDKTRKANAALAGLGRSLRILVSDTMLSEYSDDEIEVVLAHELAHHVHGDIWKGIVFESVLIYAGFYFAFRVLARFAVPFGLTGPADVAGIPLLLLAASGVSLVTIPAAHAMSRAFERNADAFALNLTGNPAAFVSAMRRLGEQNLAEDDPSRLVQWLFYSHPPVRARIAAAQQFAIDRGERAGAGRDRAV